MKIIKLACLGMMLLLAFSMSGCGTHFSSEQRLQAAESARASFAGNAIKIDLTADPQLNAFNSLPNSCTVLVLQAQRREQLESILGNKVLLRKFFAQKGGGEGVLKLDSYVMLPGQRISWHIDRAEQTRYVALIAGYYPAPDESQTRIFSIPAKLTTEGLFSRQWRASLVPLNVSLTLGRESILSTKSEAGQHGDDIVFLSQPTEEKDAPDTGRIMKSIRETVTPLAEETLSKGATQLMGDGEK